MKVVVSRILEGSCVVDNNTISSVNKGFLLLVGFTHTDNLDIVKKMVSKITKLRVFEDAQGKMNLSIKDVGGEILSISQFTLYANPYTGNRPSFVDAMNPELASKLYDEFNNLLEAENIKIGRGMFGADMKLHIVCDGPVTINLEFKE